MAEFVAEFPVLLSADERRRFPDCPRRVPWEWIRPHERQAYDNHGGQSLARLAERGGLGVGELRCAVEGKSLRGLFSGGGQGERAADVEWLKAQMKGWEMRHGRAPVDPDAITEPDPESSVEEPDSVGPMRWKDRGAYASEAVEGAWIALAFDSGTWEVRRKHGENVMLAAVGDERGRERAKVRAELVLRALAGPLPSALASSAT